jgi:hypothetical protein
MRDLGQIFSPSYFIPHPSDRTASSLVDGGPAMAGNLARKKVKKVRKMQSLSLFVITVLFLCTGTRAVCCWDSTDAYACGFHLDGLTNEPFYGCTCRDGSQKVGLYCSKGWCNLAGCDCEGGCLGGDKIEESIGDVIGDWIGDVKDKIGGRRLFSESQTLDDEPSSAKSIVGRCQDQIVTKYNTMELVEPEQILAYYNCLQTVPDGVLDEKDAVFQELSSLPNGSSLLKAIDSNGDGGIEPGEFDPGLETVPQSSGWSSGPNLFGAMVLLGFSAIIPYVVGR